MIVDQLVNADFYRKLGPSLADGLDFLRDTDLSKLPLGHNDIDGDRLFAHVHEYTTKPPETCLWEAHRKYCDIQFIASGVERMGFNNLHNLQVKEPYNGEKDAVFLTGTGDSVAVHAGMFTIFGPQDAHRCCMADGSPSSVRKVVIKAKLGL